MSSLSSDSTSFNSLGTKWDYCNNNIHYKMLQHILSLFILTLSVFCMSLEFVQQKKSFFNQIKIFTMHLSEKTCSMENNKIHFYLLFNHSNDISLNVDVNKFRINFYRVEHFPFQIIPLNQNVLLCDIKCWFPQIFG